MATKGATASNPTETERGATVASKTKVRTTINPGVVISVAEHELIDLDRQGLVHSRETDAKWKDADAVDIEPGEITDTKGGK